MSPDPSSGHNAGDLRGYVYVCWQAARSRRYWKGGYEGACFGRGPTVNGQRQREQKAFIHNAGCGLLFVLVPRGQSHFLVIAEALPSQHPCSAEHTVRVLGYAGLIMKT